MITQEEIAVMMAAELERGSEDADLETVKRAKALHKDWSLVYVVNIIEDTKASRKAQELLQLHGCHVMHFEPYGTNVAADGARTKRFIVAGARPRTAVQPTWKTTPVVEISFDYNGEIGKD